MSERIIRLQAGLLRTLSTWMLSHVHQEEQLLTSHISRVDLSKDLSYAKIFISCHNEIAQVVDYLNQNTKQARHYLSQNSSLRRIPQIYFHPDERAKLRQEALSVLGDYSIEDDSLPS